MLSKKTILIFSNNPISLSSSNGRTMSNLVQGMCTNFTICNFFIHGTDLNFNICNKFFCVEDKDTIRLWKKHTTKEITDKDFNNESPNSFSGSKRSSLKMIIRTLLWNLGLWKSKRYREWIKIINPSIVICQTGDSPFLDKEARRISKKFNSKYIVYNSEGFCLFDFNYLENKDKHNFFSKIFQNMLIHEANKNISSASITIYLNEDLKSDYSLRFGPHTSEAIYNSSNFDFCITNQKINHSFNYAGNFLHRRVDTLCLFAKSLEKYNDYHIDVFGNMANSDIEKIKTYKNIIYHGFQDYETIILKTRNAFANLCIEPFDRVESASLIYGFSTKIADLIASNRPIIYIGNSGIFLKKYIEQNKIGYVISDKKMIDSMLSLILSNGMNNPFSSSQKNTLINNHSLQTNLNKFKTILESLID